MQTLNINILKSIKTVYKEKIVPNQTKIAWSLIAFFCVGVIIGLTFFAVRKSHAAATTCYWVGDTNPAVWNDATHWSSSSGGAGSTCDGGVVPGSDDEVIFTSANNNGVTTNVDVSIASLTLQAGYTGTFDNQTNDHNFNISGNVTMDNSTTKMGDGTWTVGGSWDSTDVSALTDDASVLVMTGTDKQLSTGDTTDTLCNVTINSGASVTAPTGAANNIACVFTISGTYNLDSGATTEVRNTGGDIKITSTGAVNGSGQLIIGISGNLSQKDGPINSTLVIQDSHPNTGMILATTYESPEVIIRGVGTSNRIWYAESGTYTFNGNVTVTGNESSTGTYTVNTALNDPNIIFKGNVTFSNGTSTLNWSKGDGIITAAGTSTQALDFAGKTIEDLDVTNASAVVSITNDVTPDSFSAADNASIQVTAGKTITTADISALGGSAGSRVTLRSSSDSNQWNLNVSGTPAVTYVDVKDSNATGSAITATYSIDSGNNTNWSISNPSTTCYWVSSTSPGYWDNLANWSSSSGGSGGTCYGGTVPGPDNDVVFTSANNSSVHINQLVNIASLTLQAGYTGVFTGTSYTYDINISGDVTMDSSNVSMGDRIWTVGGNFDNKDVTTWNQNSSTLIMTGTGKTITSAPSVRAFYNLTIDTGASITIPEVVALSYYTHVYGVADIKGTLNINETTTFMPGSEIKVESGGNLSGTGYATIYNQSKLTQQDGTVDVAELRIKQDHSASYPVIAATYDSALVNIENGTTSDLSWVTSVGTYTFTGDVVFKGNDTAANSYTINNSVNNPNFDFQGNVTFTNGTSGSLAWTKGTGTITFSGTGAQTADFLDKTVEDIRDSNTADTLQLTGGVTTDQFTVDSGATLDLNSQSVNYTAAVGTYNDGTIKMVGDETIGGNISNLDTDSGWVEYTGTGAYGSLPYTGTYYNANFSGSGSFTLPANLTVAGEFAMNGSTVVAPSGSLSVAGNFSNSSGTFTHNSGTVNLNGTGQTVSGNTTFNDFTKNTAATDTLTFAAGSTQTVSGTLDLQGAASNLLSLRSSTTDTQWYVNASGSPSVSYVDVKDSNASGGSQIDATDGTNTNSGNNDNWLFTSETGQRYWISGSTSNWNNTANWSQTDGGAGGASVPDSTKDVFFNGNGLGTVTIDAPVDIQSLTLAAGYTGTFNNATNDQSVTVANDVTMDNTRTDMGDGTWTVGGNFDYKDIGTLYENFGTLVMDGVSKSITAKSGEYLYSYTVASGADITVSASSTGTLVVSHDFTVDGLLTVSAGAATGLYVPSGLSSLILNSTGRITGDGDFRVADNGRISTKDGILDTAVLGISRLHDATSYILPATYESATVNFYNNLGTSYSWTPSAGTYTFNGDVTFQGNTSLSGTYTINNANNPNFVFKGNVTVDNGTSTLNWTKGTGNITFARDSGTQTADFLSKNVEEIAVGTGSSTNTLQLTGGVTTDQFDVNSGATLDLNSQAVDYSAAVGTYNDGTIRLVGNETIGGNISNLDTDSGWVQYSGTGAYGSLPYTGTYYNTNFSGSGSFTLPANLTVAGEFAMNGSTVVAPSGSLSVAGNFSNTSGTFTHNSGTVNLNGTGQTVSGSTTFNNFTKNTAATDTLTFAAGSTQTVAGTLDLQGAASNLLSLRSSTSGTYWNLINDAGSYTIDYVDVKDSNHTGGDDYVVTNFVNSGHNIGWYFPDHYTISASDSNLAPGGETTVTLTLVGAYGATMNNDSTANITFSGASASPGGTSPTATDNTSTAVDFGTPTTLQFTDGVATATVRLYKSESAALAATDGTYSTSGTAAVAVTSPSGTISIQNASESGYITSPDVVLDLAMSGASTVGAMYRLAKSQAEVSSATYANFATPVQYTLSSGDGYKTVYGQFKDQYGNESATASSQTVQIDSTPPTVPADLQAYDASDVNSQQKVYAAAMLWTPSTDDTSGLKGYIVSKGDEGLEVNEDITSTVQLTENANGNDSAFYIDPTDIADTAYTYSVKAVDNAGNVSEASSVDITLSPTAVGATTKLTKAENLKITFEQNENDSNITGIVTWTTDAPATSQVLYGTSEGDYSNKTALSDGEQTYNTSHTKVIENLKPDITYYFKAVSADQNNNSTTLTQSATSPGIEQSQSFFELIWSKIENFFLLIWQTIKNLFVGNAQAQVASPSEITGIHVSRVVDSSDSFVGFAVYWEGEGNVALLRNGQPIATPTTNRWLDLTAQADSDPSYTVTGLTGSIEAALPGGTPEIKQLKVKAISVTQESTNVEVSWLTTGVPSTSIVKYGAASGSYSESVEKKSYDEEHRVIINGLSPDQTYFFQASSTSSDSKTTIGSEVSYTLPESAKAKSIFVIIYEALQDVFGNFVQWLNT